MASSSKIAFPSVVLALRLLVLAVLAGSIVLLVTKKVNVTFPSGDTFSFSFEDVYSYKYLLGIAVVGCAYTLLQIPLAGVTIAKRSKVIGGTTNVALFLICADVVFVLAFATAAGAGFGLSYDVKRSMDEDYNGLNARDRAENSEYHSKMDSFLVRGYAAAALVIVAAKSVAAVVLISVYALVK